MMITYEQIREIYYYKTNMWHIIGKVEDKYGIKMENNDKCLNCGNTVETSGWLCPGNDYQCIITFFNNNKDILLEAITRET